MKLDDSEIGLGYIYHSLLTTTQDKSINTRVEENEQRKYTFLKWEIINKYSKTN